MTNNLAYCNIVRGVKSFIVQVHDPLKQQYLGSLLTYWFDIHPIALDLPRLVGFLRLRHFPAQVIPKTNALAFLVYSISDEEKKSFYDVGTWLGR